MPTFLGEKCKIITFGHKIFLKNVFIQTTVYIFLYDAVNWKNNLFFNFLGMVDF